ncbi:MAG: thiamine diphosphokinase [Oscillospiraceae bacterium]
MKKCVIIGAAPCESFYFENIVRDAFVIAADGGLDTARRFGVSADLFVGDMDSLCGAPPDVSCIKLPCEKDYSDMHVALNEAISRGFKDVCMVACTGGRADHHLANLALLEFASIHSCKATILDSQNKIIYFGGGKIKLKREREYKYIALIALDEELTGVTLCGMKYPLTDATLKRSEPIAICNEPMADTMTINAHGRALIILSGDSVI